MSSKEILVALESSATLGHRMLHAASLVLTQKGHGIGLSVIGPLNLARCFTQR